MECDTQLAQIGRENVRGNVRIFMQDYNLRITVMICATMVDTHTHTHIHIPRQALTGAALPAQPAELKTILSKAALDESRIFRCTDVLQSVRWHEVVAVFVTRQFGSCNEGFLRG